MAASQTRKGSPSRGVDYEIAEEEEYYVTRPHTSVRRYRQPVQWDTLNDYAPEQAAFVQRRRASSIAPSGNGIASRAIDEPQAAQRHRHRRAPWLAIMLGMAAMLVLVVGSSYFVSWWQLHQNDSTYGRPRTYQALTLYLYELEQPCHRHRVSRWRYSPRHDLHWPDPVWRRQRPDSGDRRIPRCEWGWSARHDRTYAGSNNCFYQ